MQRILTPPMTGYLHLPPLWVLDDLDHSAPADNQVGREVDLSEASEIISARAISEELSIWFARDGFVAFLYAKGAAADDSRSVPEVLADRLAIVNAHIACLHSAAASVDNKLIDGDSATHLTVVHGRASGVSANDPVTRALLELASGRKLDPWSIGGRPNVEVTWIPHRQTISRVAVEDSIDRLTALASGGIERLRRYEMLLQAGVAIRENNYALALIAAHALAEHAAARLWQQKAQEIGNAAGGLVTKEAFKRLGANHLLHLLRISGAVPERLFLDLDSTRSARNRWAHGLVAPTADTAITAQKAAAEAMALADSLSFVVWPTVALRGWTF